MSEIESRLVNYAHRFVTRKNNRSEPEIIELHVMRNIERFLWHDASKRISA